jgi:endonuclease-3
MKGLNDPKAAAVSVKKTLHGIFETYYQFDIDFLKKENLSKAVTQFEKFAGVSPFVVSYAAQNGLGGHSIPLDRSMMLLFYTLGAISEDEATKGRVPGLERTIPKAKGAEFSVLTHQLAVAFASSPFSTKTRDQLLKINSKAKDRFPKRGAAKKAEAAAKKAEAAAKKAEAAAKKAEAAKKAAPKPVPKKTPTKTVAAKKTAAKRKQVKSVTTKKKATKSKSPRVKQAGKKTKKKAKAPIKKKLSAKSKGKKTSATKQLARKKPR